MGNDIPVINMKETGRKIRRIMDNNGVNVNDVQDGLNLASKASIYFWLNGRNVPSVDNLVALAYLLNVRIDDLLVVEMVEI